jgi:hypothetical protein
MEEFNDRDEQIRYSEKKQVIVPNGSLGEPSDHKKHHGYNYDGHLNKSVEQQVTIHAGKILGCDDDQTDNGL